MATEGHCLVERPAAKDHPGCSHGYRGFAVEALRLNPTKVIGVDISEGMLDVGRQKMKARQLDGIIELAFRRLRETSFEDNF